MDTKNTYEPFKNSNREIRGKIIKHLVVNESVEISSLKELLQIEDSKIESIIKKLCQRYFILYHRKIAKLQ